MDNQELLEKIQSGELPTMGILRRSGAAKKIRVTTVVDGEVVEVSDVDLTAVNGGA